MAERKFRPGELVPVAGVYVVLHNGHRAEHAVTMLAGDQFPPCSVCRDEVRFRLERQASAIGSDNDFAVS